MSENFEIKWLGYNEAPNHNRIWGWLVVTQNQNVFAFWGVKGKEVDFKAHESLIGPKHIRRDIENRMNYQTSQKQKKGFKEIDPSHYVMLVPSFMEDIEADLMAHILKSGGE